MAGTSFLAMWCPVCRRRDSQAGSRMARENLHGDAKGKGASGSSVRPKVPMRRSGADGFVGARKRGNARGAKMQPITALFQWMEVPPQQASSWLRSYIQLYREVTPVGKAWMYKSLLSRE